MTVWDNSPRLHFMILAGFLSAIAFGTYDYFYDFSRYWDFNVYIKAQTHFFETDSPYFERESLRYIYPPSANFILHFVSDSQLFKTIYFIITGTLWTLTACLFCRCFTDTLIVIPVLFLAYGMQGLVTVLSGNIATIMYFIAALAAWAYFTGKIPTLVFAIIITGLTMIKPFYAEFLLFIWFVEDFKKFILFALGVVALFFAVNLIFFPELFSIFLDTLKVDDYDNEIFGITMMSHLAGLGVPSTLAFITQGAVLGCLFLLFLSKSNKFSTLEKFAYIFIFAVFINPKQISYDLIVCLPALTLILFGSKRWLLIAGLTIITLSSLVNFDFAPKPWFQWWYAFLLCFALCLSVCPFDSDFRASFWQKIIKPARS